MRIAFIVHDFNRSWGHSRYTYELARRFSSHHEIHVFSNTVDDVRPPGICFHHVPAWRLNALTTILSFAVTGTIMAAVAKFDVAHSQGLCGMRASVVTAHQINRAWHSARRRLEANVAWREKVFGAVVTRLEHAFYRRLKDATMIAISDLVQKDLRFEYGVRTSVEVIYHGTDVDQFSPTGRDLYREAVRARFGIAKGERVFLFAGDVRKGARQAMLALARLDRAKMLLVSRTRMEDCRRLAAESKVLGRVILAGPSDRIEEFYAASDFLVLPTPYDPFALVVTEAMACGLPVIVSRAAGAAELVEHGVNGLILQDPCDVEELTGCMKRLLDDPESAHRMGERARETAELHTWDDVADRTMEVYKRHVEAKRMRTSAAPSKSYSS